MPGETRFEQLLGDPRYFERAFARARARAEQRLPADVTRLGGVRVGPAPTGRRSGETGAACGSCATDQP